MSESDALDERLRAVERALTDGDSDLTDLRTAAELTRDVEALSGRLDDVDERLDELDAATQALRGYVGNVRAIDESVERRADAALAKAESLEAAFGGDRARAGLDADEAPSDPDIDRTPSNFGGGGSRSDANGGRHSSDRRCGCESSRGAPSRGVGSDSGGDEGDVDTTGEAADRGVLARIAELL